MGWFPSVLENTLEENLTDEFYNDLLDLFLDIKQRRKEQRDLGNAVPFDQQVFIPDCFYEIDLEDATIEDLKYSAFDSDHMEHIGNWVYEKAFWTLFEKHKVSGKFILHHTDGEGYYAGIEFVDGVPYDVDVSLQISRGKCLAQQK